MTAREVFLASHRYFMRNSEDFSLPELFDAGDIDETGISMMLNSQIAMYQQLAPSVDVPEAVFSALWAMACEVEDLDTMSESSMGGAFFLAIYNAGQLAAQHGR